MSGWMSAGAHEYAVLAAAAGVLFSARRQARDVESVESIWRLCLVLCGVIAVLAFWDFVRDPRTAFGTERPYHIHRLSWPFLSANTAATFYGLTALMAVAELLRQMRRIQGIGIAQRLESALRTFAFPGIVAAFALTDLVLTASRAGVSLGIVAAVVLTVWHRTSGGPGGAATLRSVVPLVVVGLVGAVIILSGEVYWSRLDEGDADSRLVLFSAYLDAVRLAPLFGNGLGGFAFVNDLIAVADNANTLQNQGAAHNVVLQWLIQGGIVGAAAMFGWVAYLLRRILVRLPGRRQQTAYIRAVVLCGLLVAAHGMVDYAVEIPMIAWFVSLILGIGMGIAERGARPPGGVFGGRVWSVGARAAVAGSLLGLSVWSAITLLDRLDIRRVGARGLPGGGGPGRNRRAGRALGLLV